MKRWRITYTGGFLPFEFTTESYGETSEEAMEYAVKQYQIARSRIKSCELK